MRKLLAAMLGLGAFIAFAFQNPGTQQSESPLQDELPLVITLDGIKDGVTAKTPVGEFIAETE
jgi:hypothetical protein